MVKKLLIIFLLIPTLAIPCTCPTGDTCFGNGTITAGINNSYGANVDYLALNSSCVNQLVPTASQDGWANFGTWGYADPSLFGQTPGYTTGDYDGTFSYWNMNEGGCSPSAASDASLSAVTTITVTGNTAYAKAVPLEWSWSDHPYVDMIDGDSDYTDPPYIANWEWANQQGYLEQFLTLSGQTLHIQFKYTYLDSYDHSQGYTDSGHATSPLYIGTYNASATTGRAGGSGQTGCNNTWAQQAAFWTPSGNSQLYTYEGNNPWSNDTLTMVDLTITPSGFNGVLSKEDFVAAINPSTGYGMGIYSPQEAGVRALGGNNPNCLGYIDAGQPSVGYASIGQLLGLGLAWNFKQQTNSGYTGNIWQYDTYLTVGTISDIRSAVYSFANQYNNPSTIPATFHGTGQPATFHGTGVPITF